MRELNFALALLIFCSCVQYISENGKAFTWEELKEYNKKHPKHFNNPNNIDVSKRSYDTSLVGRWILKKDTKYLMIKDYGVTFSKDTYRAKFIYGNGHYTILEFIGNGNWFIYNDRLYLKTVWERIEEKYDSIKIEGEIIGKKDTFEEDWASIRYAINNDSTWCWKRIGLPQTYGVFLESGIHPQSDNYSGEECFEKASKLEK